MTRELPIARLEVSTWFCFRVQQLRHGWLPIFCFQSNKGLK